MQLGHEDLQGLVRRALHEDLSETGDLTSNTILPAKATADGRFVARQPLTLAGIPFAAQVYHQLDPSLGFEVFHRDGEDVPEGECVALVRGSARAILAGERTALNFLMRLSGIATATRNCVREIAGTGAAILDTRKTAPGLRAADKYAVACGGGQNHRFGLYDAAMIKDTHLAVDPDIGKAVAALRGKAVPSEQITVEVRDLEQLRQAIEAGAGRALLDNMELETMRRAVGMAAGRIVLEASGGLQPGGLRPVAETGVDCLSLGFLTHSARAADIALETEPQR
ncbi:MAG: carboxylating nicotinate-nucleotide diphosphorylase [Acidobacteria bacterium]|nr:carboxylating nicotinate-nucleotide diphosphorylase [Acidobacteriota bacterium]NIM62899.1 carboxylating nicotinate-nucleotide diphosphorylase [Acidobacteriota bacterium]NIO58842.1 carboxylating nicotinate-nucleotide diphosphorylase [Acidobacteriota bacterium]NIQ29899.1 carboxylating nicotinate-nucleotide diphosphorylase [Acidobacteriota bacterium]NIQ84623.1 carboxylating nicotinate-nucleotide diphosphorylase [Acidobacteriota bacterium]